MKAFGVQHTASGEERRQPRCRLFRAPCLKIHCYQRAVPAILVDVSEGGLGVKTLVAMPPGMVVWIEGEFESADFSFALRGTARVAHSLVREDGLFRVGLAIQDVAYRALGDRPMAPVTARA